MAAEDDMEAFRRAWCHAHENPQALDTMATGGVWRVYERTPAALGLGGRFDLDREIRVINLRAVQERRFNGIALWDACVIQARWEADTGDWADVAVGRFVA